MGEQADRAIRNWLLNRSEDARWDRPELALTRRPKLADACARIFSFDGADRSRRPGLRSTKLVTELVEAETQFPSSRIFRYKPSGLEKRALWKRNMGMADWRKDEIRRPSRKSIAGN